MQTNFSAVIPVNIPLNETIVLPISMSQPLESYCQIWCMASLGSNPVIVRFNHFTVFKFHIINNQFQLAKPFEFSPSFLSRFQ